MALSHCDGVRMGVPCRTLFAVGLHSCPQCGSTDYHEHGSRPGDEEYFRMPKIARTTGTTDANVDQPVESEPVAAVVEETAAPARESVASVLAAVDGDPDRARDALAAEQAGDSPRKTLVAQLEKLIAEDAATAPDDVESEPVAADAG